MPLSTKPALSGRCLTAHILISNECAVTSAPQPASICVRAGLLDHLLGFAAFVTPSLAAGFFTLLIPLDGAFGFGFFAFFFPYRCIPSSASIGVPSGT